MFSMLARTERRALALAEMAEARAGANDGQLDATRSRIARLDVASDAAVAAAAGVVDMYAPPGQQLADDAAALLGTGAEASRSGGPLLPQLSLARVLAAEDGFTAALAHTADKVAARHAPPQPEPTAAEVEAAAVAAARYEDDQAELARIREALPVSLSRWAAAAADRATEAARLACLSAGLEGEDAAAPAAKSGVEERELQARILHLEGTVLPQLFRRLAREQAAVLHGNYDAKIARLRVMAEEQDKLAARVADQSSRLEVVRAALLAEELQIRELLEALASHEALLDSAHLRAQDELVSTLRTVPVPRSALYATVAEVVAPGHPHSHDAVVAGARTLRETVAAGAASAAGQWQILDSLRSSLESVGREADAVADAAVAREARAALVELEEEIDVLSDALAQLWGGP
ncbi:uncharacterized protein AMSG_06780 [Thecamonas trahens ATCC 50062]|uniref:Uncharacterized protein n=1 Tax=Thecamonas trahens ATCC 50062 TaxID=461836 RepID=A0A0L0DD91_THETB|nr:hypothetical protein AMSG_06780 [Thecamonas trahens ATCC 50062]KNC50299.1 hypothetical protein AMSG_06780 [Thecamonas trahens ATCC 50062]|eukprot:XP_013756846.1 hypothetical protein AMSG_06780 [Thecamonas trahens ATCC 50062]